MQALDHIVFNARDRMDQVVALFERLGFTVQVSPVVEAPRHESLPSRAYWTLREVPALVRALINA